MVRRKRNSFAQIGIVCVGLIVALGLTGVGYAAWSDTLTIAGTVNTGGVCVGIRDTGTNDDGIGDSGLDPGIIFDPLTGYDTHVIYDKNVASCVSTNGAPKCTKDGVQYYYDITYTLTNAYPLYAPMGEFAIANCGTIPVMVQSVTVSAPSEVKVCLCAPEVGDQIDPCEVVNGYICFHVKEGAAEGATYSITVTIYCVQWNEYP